MIHRVGIIIYRVGAQLIAPVPEPIDGDWRNQLCPYETGAINCAPTRLAQSIAPLRDWRNQLRPYIFLRVRLAHFGYGGLLLEDGQECLNDARVKLAASAAL